MHFIGGLKIEGEDEAYDFGSGAGFYVDATKEPWTKGYNMYSYITKELPDALFSSFKELDSNKVSITGHSMGGHGALTLVCLHPSLLWFAQLTVLDSSSRILESTNPSPPLRPLRTQSIAPGARKHSRDTLAKINSKNGRNTMLQSSFGIGKAHWRFSWTWFVVIQNNILLQ